MKLIDVTLPLDASLPVYPGNTPFSLEAVKRIARGDSSNVSTIHMSAHAGTQGITSDDFGGIDLSEDVRLLIKTHNSRLWGSPEFHPDYVGVTEGAARFVVERSVKVVGVLSVEEFKKAGAPAHHVLLGGGTIVIEGLNLLDVEPGIYDVLCLPLRVVGSDGAPARVVLRAG